jgi:SUR7/PalI family
MKFSIPKYTSEKTGAIPNYRLKGYHIPFRHHRGISISTFVLLFIAFLIFLLVALSTPIIKTIYLLKITASTNPNQPVTSIATILKIGVWGLCALRYAQNDCASWVVSDFLLLLTLSGLDGPDAAGFCIGPELGYNIPPDAIAVAGKAGVSSSTVTILLHALVVLLVLHPIAAGLSFITFINSIFLGHHAVSIIALIWGVITALVSTVVFAIDLALVIVARSNVKSITVGHFEVTWGNGIWMVLVATILTWVGVILLSARACYCCYKPR